jgi:alkylhydroperoxidase family enzyme
VVAHAYFLQLQETGPEVFVPLARGELEAAAVSAAERALLGLVETVTRHAYRTTQHDIDRVRQAGWSDPQIAEGIYIAALFAMFNRVADAFGLEDPGYLSLDLPEE